MDMGVKDNAYIIVGGTRGMGWEAACRLARDGARLAIVGAHGSHGQRAGGRIAG